VSGRFSIWVKGHLVEADMTVKCPTCGEPVDLQFTHHGISGDGLTQRGAITATHEAACDGWKNNEYDLLSLPLFKEPLA
jgi:hypothetical protein